MNVIIRIIWGVKLDNPVNFREIKTSLGHICAEQNAFLSLAELKVSTGTLLLLLLSMDVLHWHVHIVEQVRIKLDGVAT